MVNLLILPQSPFPSFSLSLPSHLPVSVLSLTLLPLCPSSQQSISLHTGRPLPSSTLPLSTLEHQDGAPTWIRLAVKLPGGKGGFASQLRAQGGRMSSNRASNKDSCRDLNGRRLSTIKEAQRLASYIASEEERDQTKRLEAKEKLEKLEIEIARLGGGEDNEEGSGSGKKRKLEDNDYVEESEGIKEGVRDAVKLAMMKKRKKGKQVEKKQQQEEGEPKAGSSKELEVKA